MTLFEWDERYTVGAPQIDAQHCRLVELINRLREAMRQAMGGDAARGALHEMSTLAALIDEMLAYTIYHFSTEEELMTRYGYPEYRSHRVAHTEFTSMAHRLRRRFDEGKAICSADLAAVLHAWLLGGHLKTGQSWTPQNRPVEAARRVAL